MSVLSRKPGVDFMDDPRSRDHVVIWCDEIPQRYSGEPRKYRAVAVRGREPDHPALPIYIAAEYLRCKDALGNDSWNPVSGEIDCVLIYEIAKRDGTLPTWVPR